MESIEDVMRNGYAKENNSNCIKGHLGIDYSEWESEWLNLGSELSIQFTPSIIRELAVCVCSIAQLSKYSRDVYSGKIEMFRHENSVFLATTEGKPGSLYICYFNVYEDSLNNPNQDYFEPVKRPVVAIREEGVLKIKEAD